MIQFNLYVTKVWPREWQNMFHRMGLSKSIFIHFTISKALSFIVLRIIVLRTLLT